MRNKIIKAVLEQLKYALYFSLEMVGMAILIFGILSILLSLGLNLLLSIFISAIIGLILAIIINSVFITLYDKHNNS